MDFEENIRNWVMIDNKIKQYSTTIKTLREQKNELTSSIITYVAENNMEHNTIQISDGNLRFQNNKISSPLTYKFITRCLNDCIKDEDQVKQIISYIKSQREVRYVPEVKRRYAN